MKRIILLVLSLLVLLSSFCFAQKTEYNNKNFNAKNVKLIFYVCKIPNGMEQYIEDPYVLQKVYEYVGKELKEKGFRAVSLPEIAARASNFYGVDIMKLGGSDNEEDRDKANELVSKYLRMQDYDAELWIGVYGWMTGSKYNPGFSYQTTQNRTSTISGMGSDGSWATGTITTPETVTTTIPGHYNPTSTVGLAFTLRDWKTSTVIYDYRESRERVGSAFRTTDPEGVAERITGAAVEKIREKVDADATNTK